MKTVYGPVSSWRLGRSFGIDPICRKSKICSFDCIYCQLGKTRKKTLERKIYAKTERVLRDLNENLDKIEADVITFSGIGEPTLAKNLEEIIDFLRKKTKLPLAILTNSSLFFDSRVRKALYKLDKVIAKLDAPNQEILEKVNRPVFKTKFENILEGIKKFRKSYKGELALQIMFVKKNKDYAYDLAKVAKAINPDQIQINTPLRPKKGGPLSKKEIAKIKKKFKNFRNVITVYETERPKVFPIDIKEVYKRKRTKI